MKSGLRKSVLAMAIGNALIINSAKAAFIDVDDDCSLGEAIQSANTDAIPAGTTCESGEPGLDVIFVPAGTINLSPPAVGDNVYTIDSDISIQSPSDFDLNGASNSRVFYVAASGSLEINNSTISGLSLSSSSSGLKNGGIIYSAGGDVTLTSVTLVNSRVTASETINAKGGAVYMNGGTLTLNRSLLFNNSAGSGGAVALAPGANLHSNQSYFARNSVRFSGGAVAALGTGSTLDFSESNFNENSAVGRGGAIYAESATVSITGGSIRDNEAFFGSGGVEMHGGALDIDGAELDINRSIEAGGAIALFGDAQLDVQKSTFTRNQQDFGSMAEIKGGAIYIRNDFLTARSHAIRNSTFSENEAAMGGVVYLASDQGTADLTITNSTMVTSKDADYIGDEIVSGPSSTILLENSIVGFYDSLLALEPEEHLAVTLCTTQGDGSLTADNSLLEDASCGGPNTGVAGINWRRNARPDGAAPVIKVGGRPWFSFPKIWDLRVAYPSYHVPLFDSPALDSADATICGSGQLATDQRDVPRAAATCDIGAIEAETATIFVDDMCNLQTAVQSANQKENTSDFYTCEDGGDLNTVQFVENRINGGHYSEILNSKAKVRTSLKIQGPGQDQLQITSNGPIELINGGWLMMEDVVVDLNGGIDVNAGYAHLQNLTVRDSLSDGVRVSGGSLIIEDATIENNSVGGITASYAEVRIERTTISNNSSNLGAGLYAYNESKVVIANSTISGNSSGSKGGGIALDNAELTLVHTTVTNNEASSNGGGINIRNTLSSGAAEYTGISAFNSLIAGNIAGLMGVELAVEQLGSQPIIGDLQGGIIGAASATFSEAVFDQFGFLNFGIGQMVLTSTLEGGANNPLATDIQNLIEPLASVRGPTDTHFPVADGPAINGGLDDFCKQRLFGASLLLDQTGANRNQDQCDIGSVEFIVDDGSCFVIPVAQGAVNFCL